MRSYGRRAGRVQALQPNKQRTRNGVSPVKALDPQTAMMTHDGRRLVGSHTVDLTSLFESAGGVGSHATTDDMLELLELLHDASAPTLTLKRLRTPSRSPSPPLRRAAPRQTPDAT